MYREYGRGEGRLLIGLIVIGLGVLFLLENLGYVYVRDIWDFWPVILIVMGVSRLATCQSTFAVGSGLIVILIGGIFLAHNLGYIPFDVARLFWPVILILFGVSLLFRSFDRTWQQHFWKGAPFNLKGMPFNVPNLANDSPDSTHQFCIFGGSRRRVISQQYTGGEALAIFGGVSIDLRQASSNKPEVFIEANALFGGVDIRVPDSWGVSIRGMGVFGGFDDHSRFRDPQPGKPTLVVTGTAMFGGVSVRN
jgi:predicted membrane protein